MTTEEHNDLIATHTEVTIALDRAYDLEIGTTEYGNEIIGRLQNALHWLEKYVSADEEIDINI